MRLVGCCNVFLHRVFLVEKSAPQLSCEVERMSSALQAELPPELLAQARAFVEEGWATDVNELLAEALRRYLESNSSQLSETFIREDVEWGLNGNE